MPFYKETCYRHMKMYDRFCNISAGEVDHGKVFIFLGRDFDVERDGPRYRASVSTNITSSSVCGYLRNAKVAVIHD